MLPVQWRIGSSFTFTGGRLSFSFFFESNHFKYIYRFRARRLAVVQRTLMILARSKCWCHNNYYLYDSQCRALHTVRLTSQTQCDQTFKEWLQKCELYMITCNQMPPLPLLYFDILRTQDIMINAATKLFC